MNVFDVVFWSSLVYGGVFRKIIVCVIIVCV